MERGIPVGKIQFKIYKSLKFVHFKGEGEISYDYLIKKIVEVNKHPDFQDTFNTFIDFENANVSTIQEGFVNYQSFFKELQEKTRKRKWAIYSKSKETLTSAAMVHLLLSKSIQVGTFDSRKQALSFLGLDSEPLTFSTIFKN
jgi:hypothetical protein